MMEIELEERPFFVKRETGVTITKGFQFLKNAPEQRLPVVVKQYDCTRVDLKEVMEELNQHISEGLAQVRADHPHACKLLDMRVHIVDSYHVSISHVLEALDKDVSQAIKERQEANRPYNEAELRTFLVQVAEALAYAHSKGIAHRDVKPENVFQTSSGEYKVGDFGSFWEKKAMKRPGLQTQTDSGLGTPVFMSPQMKQSCQGLKVQYRPFKNDVYSLGASALNLAALDPPYFLKEEVHLDEVVAQEVGRLQLSSELATLLRDMLSAQEDRRPTMQDVLHRLTSPPSEVAQLPLRVKKTAPANPAPTPVAAITPLEESKQSKLLPKSQVKEFVPPRQFSRQELVRITATGLQLFNIQSNSWKAIVNFDTPIKCDEGSTYVLVDETRICVCGNAFKKTGNGGEAYVVHMEGRVQELPSIEERRWGAGLVIDNGDVLAFGGSSSFAFASSYSSWNASFFRYDNCLTLNLSTPRTWITQQGRMSERTMGFTPCTLSSRVYLCGPEAIDVFDLTARCFGDPLRVTLQRERCVYRVTFVVENELAIISRERTTRVNLSTLSTQQEQHEETTIAPRSSVVVREGFVYWVRWDECIKATLQQPTRFEEI